ncbi:membrin-11-like [Olea europaea subsp. europaea]|uniref:Membrin n=1 Tax=Olea europaea subsp. europaea TaxID=158383 RepID=A0A8S0QCK3_OLEEU|nr:membrin-11-like [Olea europaea subsp. europaea]
MATVAESGGGSLSELYSSSKRLLLKTRESLERIERLEYTSSSSFSSSSTVVPGTSDDQAAVIRRDINQIQSLCVDMDRLWRSIAAKSQRDLWKRKVEQVVEEAESFRTSLDKYISRHQKRMQEVQERAELLGRANGQSSHILRIFDEEAQAVQSVRNSSRMLEEAYATGVAVLSKYSEQRDHLKRAQRKALDVLNTLGLSSTLLRLIERRNRVDKWIKYVGMVFTIIIVIVFWRWTR